MNKITKRLVSFIAAVALSCSLSATFYADDSCEASLCSQEIALERQMADNYTLENLPTFSLTTKSFLSEAELAKGLKGELTDFANLFIAAEKEYGINAIFLASLAAVESGWGKYPNSDNSFFGWTNGDKYLASEDSIMPTASKIVDYYLTEDGRYYEGTTIADVNEHYNGRAQWEKLIIEMMCQIAGDIY